MDASSRPVGEVPQYPGPARRLRLRSLRCKRRILQDLLRGTQSAAQPLAAADGALAPPLGVPVSPTPLPTATIGSQGAEMEFYPPIDWTGHRLHAAAISGNSDEVRRLIAEGADV